MAPINPSSLWGGHPRGRLTAEPSSPCQIFRNPPCQSFWNPHTLGHTRPVDPKLLLGNYLRR
jgi:hypothetical protein